MDVSVLTRKGFSETRHKDDELAVPRNKLLNCRKLDQIPLRRTARRPLLSLDFDDGRGVMHKSVADLGDLEMAKKTTLSRASIIRALTAELQPLRFVHAFWESGAAAFNRIDEWSDIDLYIVVEDAAAVSETFLIVEKALTALSPVRLRREVSWPATSGIFQKFYRPAGTSEFLLVDLAVMTLSAPDKFLVREIHGDAVFLFNKGDTVRVPPLDAEAFVRGLLERRRRLAERMELFGPFVPKEIHRRKWLEALEFYRGLVPQALVEVLRMQYGPLHYDFRMRYLYREFPPEILRQLERHAFVKDPDDLAAKYPQAIAWFREAIEALDARQVRRQILES